MHDILKIILSDKQITQHTDDVLWNCVSKIYIILLTNVTPLNSMKTDLKNIFHTNHLSPEKL